MSDRDLIDSETREVGRRIREEVARRRISRQALADMARISLSTLEKALAGTRPFTLATTIRIEEALGVALRPDGAEPVAMRPPADTAPESMGAYARAAVRWIEGRWLTLRPSFGTPDHVFAYATTIRWNDAAGHLDFAESQRLDARFEQAGHVSMPNLSGHIYLVTNDHGQHRLLMLGRPTIEGKLYGLLTTLQVGSGTQLMPVACPVVMIPLGESAAPGFGLIAPDDAAFVGYRRALDAATAEDFVRFYR
ncbi:helix-turn-helix domain-containing protein [Flavisphingomonas formosensis]|uniref:helix-turn-helix domain-containing protein n=1 Tax=Flavisphingomonas formosensis TaxID=861534 RepID=UPI0012FA49BD|nr:helix-turn-helix transcriptional regulator [Sphingomonas formosensis]